MITQNRIRPEILANRPILVSLTLLGCFFLAKFRLTSLDDWKYAVVFAAFLFLVFQGRASHISSGPAVA